MASLLETHSAGLLLVRAIRALSAATDAFYASAPTIRQTSPWVEGAREFCRERHKRTLADIPKPEFGYRKLTPIPESLFLPVNPRS